MLYSIIRYAIAIVIVLCAVPIYRRLRKNKNSKNITLPQALCVILTVCLIVVVEYINSVYPVENLFVTFSSAESAYKYENMDKVECVIEGEKSTYVNGKSNSRIFPKVDNGYKLDSGHKYKIASDTYDISDKGYLRIQLRYYEGTEDYYIFVFEKLKEFEISDNFGTEFHFVQSEFYDDYYCAYVKNLDDTYRLKINNDEIDLSGLKAQLKSFW